MARKAFTEDIDYSVADRFRINPFDVIAPEEDNWSREFVNEEEYQELKESIRKYGQRVPISVRKTGDAKPKLVFGNQRLRAVKEIRTEEDAANAANPDPNYKPRMIEAVLFTGNDLEAFIINQEENAKRVKLTFVDEAKFAGALQDKFDLKDEKIAEIIGCSIARVSQLRQIRGLPEVVRRRAAKGDIDFVKALNLASLPEEEAIKIVEATPEGEKVDGETVKKAARSAGKKVGRTPKQVKEFLSGYLGNAEHPVARAVAEATLGYANGTIDDDAAHRIIQDAIRAAGPVLEVTGPVAQVVEAAAQAAQAQSAQESTAPAAAAV